MKKITLDLITWIREYLNKSGENTKAIIGISGGKDSTIAAALCAKAVGKERVIGVLMPNGVQTDIADSIKVIKTLGIQYVVINIEDIAKSFEASIRDSFEFGNVFVDETREESGKDNSDSIILNKSETLHIPKDFNKQYTTNTPARIRMTVLYGLAALFGNCRVVNTCNASENYVGYSTKWGDHTGDFSPLGNLTVKEILEIGDDLNLPKELVHKKPSDGMSGKTDEENFGFTYEVLDNYLLGIQEPEENIVWTIEKIHYANLHKIEPMPTFEYTRENYTERKKKQ